MITPIFMLLSHLALQSHQTKLHEVSFRQLPHWYADDQRQALKAFQRSCRVLIKPRKTSAISNNLLPLTSGHWHGACKVALSLHNPTRYRARRFFENWFVPVQVSQGHQRYGVFTGYYTPYVAGSLKKHGHYRVPLYAKPKYRHIPREAINRGALFNQAKVLAWVRNRVDRFFLQIQGSGIVVLDNGRYMRLGYAAKNGWPYTSISKILLENGLLTARQLSLHSVKDWLYHHPVLGGKMMDHNESFVFFHKQRQPNALGQFNVPLTPRRSLAVDHSMIPFGVPVWLDTWIPVRKAHHKPKHFRRLLIAQDTGAAIRGSIRGDVYMGLGYNAKVIAGKMHYPGRMWLLLPKLYA